MDLPKQRTLFRAMNMFKMIQSGLTLCLLLCLLDNINLSDAQIVKFCYDRNYGGMENLQQDLSNTIIVCQKDPVALVCCVNGINDNTVITWQQFDKDDNIWRPFTGETDPTYYSKREYKENNQVAIIGNTNRREDEGLYRCTVTSPTLHRPLIHEIDLKPFDCPDSLTEKPIGMEPYSDTDENPKTEYRRLPGECVKIPCMGIFGNLKECDDDMTCIIVWSFFNRTERQYKLLWNSDPSERVYVTKNWEAAYSKRSDLHICDIRQSDYGQYRCSLSNTYGSTIRNVTLVNGVEVEPSMAYLKPLVIALVVSFSVIFLISVTLFVKRDTLRLYWKDHLAPKEQLDKIYDVFFLYEEHSEQDSKLVDTIVEKLRSEPLGYRVCLIKEIPDNAGKSDFTLYGCANDESRRIVVIVSEDLINNPSSTVLPCLRDAVIDKYSHLIFITYKDAQRAVTEELIQDKDIQLAFNIAKKVKWPGGNSERALEQFWRKLRKYLPPLPDKKQPIEQFQQPLLLIDGTGDDVINHVANDNARSNNRNNPKQVNIDIDKRNSSDSLPSPCSPDSGTGLSIDGLQNTELKCT